MKRYSTRSAVMVLLLLLFRLGASGQDYRSVLRDKMTGEPISGATIALLSADSVAIVSTISDESGGFAISGARAKVLQVAHLLYKTLRLNLSGSLPDTLYLEPQENLLDELIVKAERPIMKLIEGGIPSYDIDVLFKNSPVTTAYEMLAKLPGMSMQDGKPTLIGVNGYTLVLNGRPSNVPQDQLLEMLKTIPVQMVANVEISYTPLAKYHAKGASINVVLKQQSESKGLRGLAGQLFGTYTTKYYDQYDAGGNITYSDGDGFSATGSYKGAWGASLQDMTFDTRPFGSNKGLSINNVGSITSCDHTAFLDLSYIKGRHDISANYYAAFSPDRKYIEQDKRSPAPLERNQQSKKYTHHTALEYVYNKHLMMGAFYTNYYQQTDVQYGLESIPLSSRAFSDLSNQRSDVFGAHIDDSYKSGRGWTWEYGSKFSLSSTTNSHLQRILQGKELDEEPVERVSRELLADVYLGVNKQLAPDLNVGLTLIGDYAKYFGQEENVQLIPQASMMYTISPDHILKLSLTSEKKFPSYFEREPFVTMHGEYQQWQGNPNIRSCVSYEGQLVYMLKRKYIFVLGNTYEPNYFAQLIYLDPNINKIVYKTWNWHYRNSLGVTAVLPLPKTSWWQGRLIVNGQSNSVKLDVPFADTLERHRFMFFSSLTNDFTLSLKHNLTAGLDLAYVTGGMQGFYTFSDITSLNLRAKWMSRDKKWSVTLSGNDLFNRATPRVTADYGIHKFEFVPSRFNRSFSLDIRYTFGSFEKEKKPIQLTTNRFGI